MDSRFSAALVFITAILYNYIANIGSVTITEPSEEEMTVAPGEEIKVVCEAPVGVNVDWRHRGVYVQRLTDYSMRYRWLKSVNTEEEKILHTLIISGTTFDDAGLVECVNLDELFTDKDQVEVKVAVNEMFKSQVLVSPSSLQQELILGSEYHFKCTGGQNSDVYWTQDGTIVEDSVTRPVVERRDGSFQLSLLTFLSVNETDAGIYQCIDSKKKWRSSEEITVKVVESSSTSSGCKIFILLTRFTVLTPVLLTLLTLITR